MPPRFQINRTNPRAIQWAQDHAAELVTSIGDTTRERIRQLVTSAFVDEFDVDELADQIQDIIGDEHRAEVIARTETMLASNQGQLEAWAQAVEAGLLTGDEIKEVIVTPDDRLCPFCEPMDGQQAFIWDEFVGPDGHAIEGPPFHPQCRCTVGIVAQVQAKRRAAEFNSDQPRDERGRWTGGDANAEPTLKHGTSIPAAKAIKKTGLKPGYEGTVWTASDINLAMNYASQYGPKAAVVVLKPEAASLFKTSDWHGMKVAITKSHVPPEFIKEVRIYDTRQIDKRKGQFPRQTGGDKLKYELLEAREFFFVLPIRDDSFRDAEFNPDQPRDDHGRWTDTGVDSGVRDFDKMVRANQVERNLELAMKTADKMGFRRDKIRIADGERRFTVGGRDAVEAAHYDSRDGLVNLRRATLEESMPGEIRQIVAHEIAHDAFYKTWVEEGGPPSMVAERDVFMQHIGEHRDQLIRDDGVSDYSRAHWKDYHRVTVPGMDIADIGEWVPSGDKDAPWLNNDTGELRKEKPVIKEHHQEAYDEARDVAFRRAVNETLAEIAAIKAVREHLANVNNQTVKPIESSVVKPVWQTLYNMMMENYRKANKAAATERAAEFDPNQPRDEDGRWVNEDDDGLPEDNAVSALLRESIRQKEFKVYHGTADDIVDAVKKNGLVPKGSLGSDTWAMRNDAGLFADFEISNRPASVFIAPGLRDAAQYALLAQEVRGGEPVIFEVQLPPDKVPQLIPDEHDRFAFRMEEPIPPTWIKRMAKLAPNDTFVWRELKSARKFYVVILADQPALRALRFDPDQPRDEEGQWTDTGASRSDRANRALKAHKPFSLEKDRWAARVETEVVDLVRGEPTDNNSPVDVVVQTKTGRRIGIEVKTMLDNSNDKVTVRSEAMARKHSWARKNRATLHTIVVDDRAEFGHDKSSGHRLYYRKGVGSFRLSTLTPVKDAAHLRKLMRL